MNKIFAYFGLATSIISVISAIQQLIHAKSVTGPQLAAVVHPVLDDLSIILPHVNVPEQLLSDASAAVADVINQWVKQQPTP